MMISAAVAVPNGSPPILSPPASDPNRRAGQRKTAAMARHPISSGALFQRRKRSPEAAIARTAPIVSQILPGHPLIHAWTTATIRSRWSANATASCSGCLKRSVRVTGGAAASSMGVPQYGWPTEIIRRAPGDVHRACRLLVLRIHVSLRRLDGDVPAGDENANGVGADVE